LSISAIYFEIINCFNLIHLLISIPPSTKAVMKRQLKLFTHAVASSEPL